MATLVPSNSNVPLATMVVLPKLGCIRHALHAPILGVATVCSFQHQWVGVGSSLSSYKVILFFGDPSHPGVSLGTSPCPLT